MRLLVEPRREYLSKLARYRQRVWTCSRTGASNMTYEEALSSEANLKVAKVRILCLRIDSANPGNRRSAFA